MNIFLMTYYVCQMQCLFRMWHVMLSGLVHWTQSLVCSRVWVQYLVMTPVPLNLSIIASEKRGKVVDCALPARLLVDDAMPTSLRTVKGEIFSECLQYFAPL